MVAIPLPLASSPGRHNHAESGGRLVNLFCEPLADKRFKRIRTPGLTSFLTSSESGFRGMMLVEPTLYVAFDGELMRGTSAGGAMTSHAALPGTTPVYFARNNAATPDKVVVTENGAFTIVDPNTINAYPDPDLPQPNAVCMLDGYFVFTIGDGRMYASDLNTTSVNALSFGTAEVKSDTPIRPIPYAGRLLVYGDQSTEVWIDVGATPFPFQRAATIPFGLLGPDAVAGWEDGFGSGLLWVADDFSVRQLDGYNANRVSTPDLDRLIARDGDQNRLLASVHVVDGHPMWTITGQSFTWEYNLNTRQWHERESYLVDRWRGLQSVSAFERWLIGDRDSGNVYEIDPENYTEDGDPMRARLETGPVAQFPQRVRVARADFEMQTGVGVVTGTDPIETDPTVQVSWSDDGGTTWSVPLFRKMGRQARADTKLVVLRTGMSRTHGRRWRLDVDDPVYVSFLAGDMSPELRRP
jgi:hypothetical protein